MIAQYFAILGAALSRGRPAVPTSGKAMWRAQREILALESPGNWIGEPGATMTRISGRAECIGPVEQVATGPAALIPVSAAGARHLVKKRYCAGFAAGLAAGLAAGAPAGFGFQKSGASLIQSSGT